MTAPFPWCYLGINPDVPSHAYAGTYKQILAGECDFVPPIEKGNRAKLEHQGEMSITHNLRRQGLLS